MKRAAIGLIFSEDKREVLLVLRRDVPLWVLPGGGIEEGETEEEACRRELEEETGLKVLLVRKIGTYISKTPFCSDASLFEFQPLTKGPLLPQKETRAVAFFPLENLPSSLFFLHKTWIFDAIQSQTPFFRTLEGFTIGRALSFLFCHPLITFRYLLSRLHIPYNSKN